MSYVLLREHNEYDQYGSYFVAWFADAPTETEIADALKNDEYGNAGDLPSLAKFIIEKGGRKKSEWVWFTLKNVKSSNKEAQS